MNRALASLPPSLTRAPGLPGGAKGPVERPTLDVMNRGDPSEAIRSAEILPLLSRWFDVLEVRGYGGTVLHLLLEGIAGNFSAHVPGSLEHLRALFDLEDQLLRSGALPHDFAVVIAKPRV